MTAWEIAATILVPLLGIVSGLLGVKWRKGMRLLRETSEAVVALGLCGLRLQKAVDNPTMSAADRDELVQSVKKVGTEFNEAIAAATDLVTNSR